MPSRKDINNNSESSSYDLSGWWFEKHINEPADMTPLKTKKNDGWWYDSQKYKTPEAAVSEKEPVRDVKKEEAPKEELTELEKHQAMLRLKYAKVYKALEKAEVKEDEPESDEPESDDYDSDGCYSDLSSSDSEEEEQSN